MSEERYVIGNALESPWLLSLEPYPSVERAQRAVRWQLIGQGQFDPPGYWQEITADELRALLPTMCRIPYTEEAWAAFLAKMLPEVTQ